jgi:hypothetical protein
MTLKRFQRQGKYSPKRSGRKIKAGGRKNQAGGRKIKVSCLSMTDRYQRLTPNADENDTHVCGAEGVHCFPLFFAGGRVIRTEGIIAMIPVFGKRKVAKGTTAAEKLKTAQGLSQAATTCGLARRPVAP